MATYHCNVPSIRQFNADFQSVILWAVSVLKGDNTIHDSKDKNRTWNILTSQQENDGLQLPLIGSSFKELDRKGETYMTDLEQGVDAGDDR